MVHHPVWVFCLSLVYMSCLLDLHLVIIRLFTARRARFLWRMGGGCRMARAGLDVVGLLDLLEGRIRHQILGCSIVANAVFHGDRGLGLDGVLVNLEGLLGCDYPALLGDQQTLAIVSITIHHKEHGNQHQHKGDRD